MPQTVTVVILDIQALTFEGAINQVYSNIISSPIPSSPIQLDVELKNIRMVQIDKTKPVNMTYTFEVRIK